MLNLKPYLPYYKYLLLVWPQFIIAVIAGIVYGLSSGLALPLVAEKVFPMLFDDGDKNEVPAWLADFVSKYMGDEPGMLLLLVSLALPLMMTIRGLSSFINSFYMTYCGLNVVQAIQKKLFRKIQSLPLDFFSKSPLGMTVMTVIDMPNIIKSVIVDVSNKLIKEPFTLLGALGYLVMLAINSEGSRIAMLGAITIPLCVFPIRRVGKYIISKTRALVGLGGGLNDCVIQTALSPMEIRAYNLQNREIDDFEHKLGLILKLNLKKARYKLGLTPLIEILSAFGLAISLYLGVRNGMTYSEFMGLFIALFMCYEPIKKLGTINSTIAEGEIPLEQITNTLNMADAVPDSKSPITPTNKVKGKIEFRNASFKYNPDDQPALSNVNATITPGEVIALVGHSGAGKTSFANLIPRFYDAASGSILIDNIDIKDLDKEFLRDQIALVPQMPMLFNTSIMENIRLGRLDASDEEVIKAATLAYAHEFIMQQQEGYQTMITERGNSLSGGQRQRISIARAILKNAPIIILDEATSALDNDSEHKIQQALNELSKRRTVIMIAHRFSSLKSATRTFYFEKGQLINTGSHKELLSNTAGYKQLYERSLSSE